MSEGNRPGATRWMGVVVIVAAIVLVVDSVAVQILRAEQLHPTVPMGWGLLLLVVGGAILARKS